ncbi:MAG: hypothetical protein IH987_17335 [Planctomycetes bacterium]|nr:hypothetical protein [Planctomycetota bacterium]
MNSSFKSGFHLCSLALVGLCLMPGAALAQVLSASANHLAGVSGVFFFEASVVSIRCKGFCDGAPGNACTGDAECVLTGPCVGFPDGRCTGNPAGITTVIDAVLAQNPGCPGQDFLNIGPLFSWFSISELPGGTFFPKIFSGVAFSIVPTTNTWQTTSAVVAMPGTVRIQQVCLPITPPEPAPISGPINYFNAMAWSPNFNDPPVASVQAIESASLASSSTLADGAGSEVWLESLVDELRPGVYRYEYIFENDSPETVTILWDSANLTRTLEPYEVITVTKCADFGAKESQGYAYVVDLDGEPIAELVSMALVPIQSSASQRRCRQENATAKRIESR